MSQNATALGQLSERSEKEKKVVFMMKDENMKKYVIDLDKDVEKENKTNTKVYAFVSSDNIYLNPISFSDKKNPEYNVFAEFKIIHAKWMTGTWKENLNYFYSKCLELLENEGLIEENACGFKFLKDGCMG